jgi:hypothetical protein
MHKIMKNNKISIFFHWFFTIGKKNRFMVFASFLFFFLTSCEDVITVKLSDEDLNLIAVEAQITTQDQPTVYLYRTLNVDEDVSYPTISGATVVITDDASPANQITLTEDTSNPGHYVVPNDETYLGVAGRSYTLTIQTGSVTITANDKLSKVSPIDSMIVEPSSLAEKKYLGVFISAQEPEGLGNYYKWDIYVNNTLLYEAKNLAVAEDKYIDGNYVSKLEIYTDIHDSDEKAKLNVNDVVQVKQTSVSEFAYNYYVQMIDQSSQGLFSVPAANIKSNFTSSDGKTVLGIFVARDVSVSDQVTITQAVENQLQ